MVKGVYQYISNVNEIVNPQIGKMIYDEIILLCC